MTTQATTPPWQERRDQWLVLVRDLLDGIARWSETQGWSVAYLQKEIHDDLPDPYFAPILRIRTPGGVLHVDPIALDVVGAAGRVDLEAWPSLNRVKLIRDQKEWRVITDSGVPLREPWNEVSFVQLAMDLVAAP